MNLGLRDVKWGKTKRNMDNLRRVSILLPFPCTSTYIVSDRDKLKNH